MSYPSNRIRVGRIFGIVLARNTIRANIIFGVLPMRASGQAARTPQCYRAALLGVVSLQQTRTVRREMALLLKEAAVWCLSVGPRRTHR